MTRNVILSRGKIAVVDDDDAQWVRQWKWSTSSDGRAVRRLRDGTIILMHRAILEHHGIDLTGYVVDHINRDPLDNQFANLRPCTAAQNLWNRPASSASTTGYKGVFFHQAYGWHITIITHGERLWRGYFKTLRQALCVYNQLAREKHGEFAEIHELPDDPNSPVFS